MVADYQNRIFVHGFSGKLTIFREYYIFIDSVSIIVSKDITLLEPIKNRWKAYILREK